MSSLLCLPRSFTSLLLFLILPQVLAEPATVPFSDCFDRGANTSQKLDINTVYAQILPNEVWGKYLNLTLLGNSSQGITGFSNTSNSLSTLFTTTNILTLTAATNTSYLCSTLRPPSPLPALDASALNYCPVAPGPFAFSVTVPLGNRRALTTLTTRVRAVDPFTQELFCIDVSTTPLDPSHESPYGQARIILWATVALTIAYWAVVGVARVISAWGRGITRPERGLWARARSAGFILASAISGERLAASPALMRFCTPSMRDIIFHTQWCSALVMVAVEWPAFVYPILSQTAWSTLTYNVTLVSTSESHWDPLTAAPYSPPQEFADQLADPSSPLFVDASAPNVLFTLPQNATRGIAAFAYTVGLRPEDLFATCLILFLGIIGAMILISVFVWCIDHLANLVFGSNSDSPYPGLHTVSRLGNSRNLDVKEDAAAAVMSSEENKSQSGHAANLFRPSSRFSLPVGAGNTTDRGISTHRAWWRIRSDINSFHGSVLHGNIVRILVLFHLPVTIFSCYHMTLPHHRASMGSIILAALSFTVFSVLIPIHLVLRVTVTSTNKLYEETRTLLNYGPLYNHYRHGSQMFASLLFATNLVFGVTIGAGQKSGTTQAIIILVVEVMSALVTSVWLPWGSGASMGLISFLFCVARIVVAVLLVILTPAISIGTGPAGWVAYGIMIIMALVFLALLLMLLVKLVEAVVRIVGQIGFDRSKHVVDSGLLGALGLIGCCGPSSGRRKRKSRRSQQGQQNTHRSSDSSSYIPPLSPTAMYEPPDSATQLTHPPKFLGSSSRKGSTNSGPPASVLRPEHALMPYREDSDDEGYIMGAWQPFPPQRSGYVPVTDGSRGSASETGESNQAQKHSKQSSGFSRVRGGRANMDSPYSIAPGGRSSGGSIHTFPSIGANTAGGYSPSGPGPSGLSNSAIPPPAFYDYDDDSPPPSLSNISNVGMNGLPPGAMQPSHVRTKSQSAIIEDAGWLVPILNSTGVSSPPAPQQQDGSNRNETNASSTGGVVGLLRPRLSSLAAAMTSGSTSNTGPTANFNNNNRQDDRDDNDDEDDDDDDSEHQQPKKKPWYFLKRHRAQSSGDSTSPRPSPPAVDPEFGGLSDISAPSGQAGRSFVVIRKNQTSSARAAQTSTSSGPPPSDSTGGSVTTHGPRTGMTATF
ncbi:hypothetical protein AMATHDRAFT_66795 [Amanita thiersii Skay4041]|uniref:TRP C-terminal domain-containing protein n=1 Tax=Amanita thiersii Skay4041 TaxID=703135 RepID=A0A2A9NJC1_9AGAR|nr:hypothetical protein AMATHDRAFT_66795 [Amanita thiersii Skay4041]